VIRVVLPAQLRTLARIEGEVALKVSGAGNAALRARRTRRATRCYAVRFVTGPRKNGAPSSASLPASASLSHETPDAELPAAVATGAEPLLVVAQWPAADAHTF